MDSTVRTTSIPTTAHTQRRPPAQAGLESAGFLSPQNSTTLSAESQTNTAVAGGVVIAPFTGWPAAVPNYSRLPHLLRKAPMSLMPGAQYVGPIPASNYANNGGTKIGTATHVIVGS